MRAPVAPTGWPSEMPEPLTLSRSKSASAEAPLAGAGQDLGGEGLVELDEVHVGQREPGAAQRRARWPAPGRCPWSRRHARRRPSDTSRASGRRPRLGAFSAW